MQLSRERKLWKMKGILLLQKEALRRREISKDFEKRRLGEFSFLVVEFENKLALKIETL
jgi:hypothetical protein